VTDGGKYYILRRSIIKSVILKKGPFFKNVSFQELRETVFTTFIKPSKAWKAIK
jgi:hypothetical protein